MLKVVRKDGGGEVQAMSDSMTNGDAPPEAAADRMADIRSEESAPKAVRGTGRRLHGAIAHKLGAAIVSGEYRPGDTLSGRSPFPRRSTCRAARIARRCRC